jgi:8-hydroxy-5-deazaflavin:NADPH oxidoreductase
MSDLAIIGVGAVGAALGERLTEVGRDVVFGVRPGRDVAALLARCGDRASAASVAEACARAAVVFLAVPAEDAVGALAGAPLSDRVVVDCTNPVDWAGAPVWAPPPRGSMTAELAAAYPQARLVKGFATFGAAFHRDPLVDGRGVDVHLAGDDLAAKDAVAAIARGAGFTPLDCGPLRNAALLENLAVLWIHLARHGLGRNFAFQAVSRGPIAMPPRQT